MCLTATATPRVREDIITTLSLNRSSLKIFAMTTARPNLHHEVRFKSDDQDHFDEFLSWLLEVYDRRKGNSARLCHIQSAGERVDGISGIIYTLFRTDCENIASRLCSKGIGAKPYHAGLSNMEKDEHLNGWVQGKVGYDVIVATTAFGMGIDKDNVRFVCHWQLPKSFEGFYQEAGRAGRDGKASICMMVGLHLHASILESAYLSN
jgi:superfamily II DNA helicase RecQ